MVARAAPTPPYAALNFSSHCVYDTLSIFTSLPGKMCDQTAIGKGNSNCWTGVSFGRYVGCDVIAIRGGVVLWRVEFTDVYVKFRMYSFFTIFLVHTCDLVKCESFTILFSTSPTLAATREQSLI